MNFLPYSLLLLYIIILFEFTIIQIVSTSRSPFRYQHFTADCGSRLYRRDPHSFTNSHTPTQQQSHPTESTNRKPKIIAGLPTKEGQFPWQASLELLHPSLGFLGHWCGAVLIHKYWILSAAHCVHNDLFNLPIPPLWTVVLGEHNRLVETGFEQRIPVEKIVLHKNYHNFLHDLVLMKLSKPADLSERSTIRRICLPFIYNERPQSSLTNDAEMDEDILAESEEDSLDPLSSGLSMVPEKFDNFLRSVQHSRRQPNITLPSMKDLLNTKIQNLLKKVQPQPVRVNRSLRPHRRRNDKLMRILATPDEYDGLVQQKHHKHPQDYMELPYIDCIATGWGKWNITGDLTHLLLKTRVPLHNNGRCREAYGSFVKIHNGHLCAGKLNGKGGTCVGDSGGPLQCRITKGGPWILAGITSFGSGCAIEGFPDVYTRTSYYMKWIQDTINFE